MCKRLPLGNRSREGGRGGGDCGDVCIVTTARPRGVKMYHLVLELIKLVSNAIGCR